MLTREERKERNTTFWNNFRIEMRKVKSSNGRGMNWLNYPTDVKDVYIRLESDSKGTRLCMDIQPKDDGIRAILWEQMTELKVVMETEMGVATAWKEHDRYINNRNVSRIYWETNALNFYQYEDQPQIVDFLKDRLIRFDKFYQEFKDILIALAE